MAALFLTVGASRAQPCNEQWLYGPGQGVPGIFTNVRAVTTWDPDGAGPMTEVLVAAGSFVIAGDTFVNRVALWDGAAWHALGDGLSYAAWALAVYNGELIVGGDFVAAGGVAANHIARWNGSVWRPLGAGTSGSVRALAVYNGELVAGGTFSSAGGVPAKRVARWNGSVWQPMGSGIESGTVYALAAYKGDLIVGGGFTGAGGSGIDDIARWDGSDWFPLGTGVSGVNPFLKVLTVYGGDLIAGGGFTSAGGISAQSIARWDGTAWHSLEVSALYRVDAMAVYNGELIAGGDSTVLRWNGSVWQSLGAGITGGAHISGMAVCAGELIVGGAFAGAGDTAAKSIARWNGSSWRAMGSGLGGDYPDPEVGAFTVHNGDLIMGGGFRTAGAGGESASMVARWDPASSVWQPVGSGMSGVASPIVTALGGYNGDLVAGGRFYFAGGVSAANIARWDGAGWLPLGNGVSGGNPITTVAALAVFRGEMVAAGLFSYAGGLSAANNIARWNSSAWLPLGSGLTGSPYSFGVAALAVHEGELIAGGRFTDAGGVPVSRIARWNGSSWQPMGVGATAVSALAMYNGDMIAAGGFSIAGGGTAAVARWDGSDWQAVGSTADLSVWSLAVYHGVLIAGGRFSSVGGMSGNNIALWNGVAWKPMGSGLAGPVTLGDPRVQALTVHDDELIVGGRFTTAGGRVSAYWARWGCGCYADCDDGGVLTIADFACFQGKFAAGDPYADCDGDSALTLADFGCFQTKFVAGCP